MTYSAAEGFIDPGYGELAAKVILEIYNRSWDADKIREAERNIKLGTSHANGCCRMECQAQAVIAETRAEKNYWVIMRMLAKIRARMSIPLIDLILVVILPLEYYPRALIC